MISQVFSPIVERILIKLQMVLNHSWGWIISGMIFLLNFISPVKYAFAAMGVAITADLLFGMFSAKKQGKFFLSQSGRDTPAKVIVYFSFMLVVFVTERIFTQDNAIITKAGCTLACVCELWSMLGSALIIWPNMMFPKLLKLQLKGEIESKLGKNISNQLDKEDCKMTTTPRGIRNNNPGNIRNSERNDWAGEVSKADKKDNAFEEFKDIPHGIRAMMKLLLKYQRSYNLHSIKELIERWAPRDENDTAAYVRWVCREMQMPDCCG